MAERLRGFWETYERYLETIALTRRPNTVARYRSRIADFIRHLKATHRHLRSFAQLKRRHIEGWLRYEASRKVPTTNSLLRRATRRHNVIGVRHFLEELSAWGWEKAPPEGLFLRSDLPPLEQYLPKPLSQESDEALKKELRAMGTIKTLGLLLLRATGMRIGELRDLELDCLEALPENQWAIRVPLGKLHSDRVIPVDGEAVKIVEEMRRLRGFHPPIPHPDTGKPTHFLLLRSNGRRPGLSGVGKTLRRAAERAQLKERAWPHRLRHTYATEMLRGGMSLPVLMRILGHRTIGMTLMYSQVTQSDVQRAYLATLESTKHRYKLPEPPLLVAAPAQTPITAANTLTLLHAAASQMEAFRRNQKNPLAKKKLQRLVERLRRAAQAFARIQL